MLKLAVIFAFLAMLDIQGAFASRLAFTDRHDYAPCGTTAAADVNGDGIPDLICREAGVQIFLGHGDGTFRSGPFSDVSVEFIDVKTADLNGDGKTDLVLLGLNDVSVACCIAVSYGNGDGTFQTATSYPVGTDKQMSSLVLGDFNDDGTLDVGTLGESGFWLFTGAGGGLLNAAVLTPLTVTQGSYVVTAGDFNRDGNLDVAAGIGADFAVLLGNGDATFRSPLNTPSHFPNLHSTGMASSDLNGDGIPDIVLVNNSCTYVLVYLGKGDGTFSNPFPVNLPGNVNVAIADVNSDGVPDLISDGVYVALGRGNGTFREPKYYAVGSPPQDGALLVYAADLRKKGLPDIVVNNTFVGISVLLNEGNGDYQDGTWSPVIGGGAGCPAFADYNGDGKPDMAVGTNTGVSLLLGTGQPYAPFTQANFFPVSNFYCMTGGDLNKDGIPDLLVVTLGTYPAGFVLAYLGNGDGTFTLKSSNLITQYGVPVLADFNGDGNLDYALNGNLYALGNGDGTLPGTEADRA